ncbi:MAG: hypothetical protein ACI4EU_02900 [Butyrivibrio sp.]
MYHLIENGEEVNSYEDIREAAKAANYDFGLHAEDIQINSDNAVIFDYNDMVNKNCFVEVFEENAGDLYVAVRDLSREPVAVYNNLEYSDDSIKYILGEIKAGCELERIADNGAVFGDEAREIYDRLSNVVADHNGFYPERMGASARKQFNIGLND